MKKNLFPLLVFILPFSLWAAGYDTLPKGVNTLVFKQVMTSKIESKFDDNSSESSYMMSENFTSSKLENISDAIKTYFDELKAISPEAYNQFSLGEFSANASAQVNAQGLGFGHGITDQLTVYGSLPIYHIKTIVNFSKTKASSLTSVQGSIQNAPTNTALSKFVKDLTLQIPETNEELMQSVLVNYYGYKPLGTWEKDALGDAEIGFIYKLTDSYDRGTSISFGIVLPTGEADDPNSLQDVSTGDGQTDLFAEMNTGISFFNQSVELDFKTRYTYQTSTEKNIRSYDDASIPLGKNAITTNEKLGNKIETAAGITYKPNIWLNLNSNFLYSYVGKTEYSISDLAVKNALEENTSTSNQWVKVGVGFSSVDLYKAKKFDIPADVNLSAQKLINAKNSANYTRFDLDLKLYF